MLQHRFIDSARRHPDKVAFIDRSLGRDITYSQALLASLILARRFKKMERGRIGIMLPTSSGAALAVIGSVFAGLTPVMINYSTGAQKNCVYAQQQCDFQIIISTRALLEKTGCEALPRMIFIEDILGNLSAIEKAIAFVKSKLPGKLLKRLCGSSDLSRPAVILFTSGSEKDPKVVQLTQKNILSNIDSFSDMMDIHKMDNLLAVLPYFHVFGLTINLWTPLCLGMTSITYANPLEFKSVAGIIRDYKPELLVGTPLFLEGYVKQSKPGDFSSIQLAVSGADKCPDRLRALYREKHGIEIFEGYGTTETSPVISANPRDNNKPGSIGVPIPGTQVKIEHLDTGHECATGETGKILVKGDGVMQGYLNDLEESSLRLKSGWYDTGDLGYLDEDGFIWHKGRLKRFVKIGGEMISLVMVEETLNDLTPEDVECCVVELPDAKRGSKIVAVTNSKVDQQKINKLLSKEIPNLALPKKYVLVPDLPRMGSGKTDFRTLTKMVLAMEEHG
ncbi:MAG: bifunctional acyl-ACP--phospholipid O-acyltransferase/long-chain-fatty-acid--ACP ligase [SAR86 cluster bacterium]|uniref:Bifunctional acyl-ACP--phospholipid O-acyltransferase/long-chain-fatty-acid--ACP ligase n=1 Tax=SAR86 cluster bacterium TaxID=2030880 RepID=A0A2A5B5V2_9GAMM|nr:MAG: bifunctional acyl-ACP--phospholipid O-acyltransferase/long-chain-fatty-acid--ACP ligase [SAR86 cluster bacterium]